MRVLNDNINVEDEEDEITDQEVRDKEPNVTRSGGIFKTCIFGKLCSKRNVLQ
jgi:hypothetical protein